MYKIKTINNISKIGLKNFDDKYTLGKDISDPDAIIVRSAKLHDMEFPKELKFIGRAGAGVNNIPIDRASAAGIIVANAPGANANAVKELVIAMMLMSSRRVLQGIDWVKEHIEEPGFTEEMEMSKKKFIGPEVRGKTIGIIGLGEVGTLIANTCIDLGMKVYGYDPYITVKHAWYLNQQVKYERDIKAIFQNSDYITIHLPYTKETATLINKDLLEMVKPGLRLMNFARGDLIDIDMLLPFLHSGKIAYYITDFPDVRTKGDPSVINVPHLGASTPESEDNSAIMVVNEIIDYLEKGIIRNSVNFPDCSLGELKDYVRIVALHRNIPGMLSQITSVLTKEHINISDLVNRSKKDWACTMIDVDNKFDEEFIKEKIKSIDAVVRVRMLK